MTTYNLEQAVDFTGQDIFCSRIFTGCSTPSQISAINTPGNATVNLSTPTGTAQSIFNLYNAQTLNIAQGTSTSPITTAGPTVKISRIENIASSIPNGSNTLDNECNASLAVYSIANSTDQMQNCAIFAGSEGSQTSNSQNANLGIYAIGRSFGAGVVTGGTGAYIEGRNETSTGSFVGQETRATNLAGSNYTYNISGFNNGGHWITCNAASTGFTSGTGVALGSIHPFVDYFDTGFAVTQGAVQATAFRDDSGSATSFKITGNHTTGLDTSGATFNSGGGPIRTALSTATGTSPGATGNILWDANFIYVCTSTNTWKRATLNTF